MGSWWIPKSLQVSAAPSSSNKEDNVYVGCSSVRLFSALRWITWLSPLQGLGVEKMISISASKLPADDKLESLNVLSQRPRLHAFVALAIVDSSDLAFSENEYAMRCQGRRTNSF